MFFEVLVSLLGKHGVAIRDVNVTETGGVKIDIDFSEHDNVFEDKIEELEKRIQELDRIDAIRIDEKRELKQRIAELENKETVELPFDALETANMLINAKYKAEIPFLEKQVDRNVYDINDLEQIAEHLIVYCKHHREDDE